jgi:hypothetical protein
VTLVSFFTALDGRTGGGGVAGNGLTVVWPDQVAVGAVLLNQFYAARAIRLNRRADPPKDR